MHELLQFAHYPIEFLQSRVPLRGIESEGRIVIRDLRRRLVLEPRQVGRVPIVQELYELSGRMIFAVAPGGLLGVSPATASFSETNQAPGIFCAALNAPQALVRTGYTIPRSDSAERGSSRLPLFAAIADEQPSPPERF